MRVILSILLILFASISLSSSQARSIDNIRGFLKARRDIPKIFIPEQLTLGKATEILVVAPGASFVKLLGSTQHKGASESGLHLGLGNDYQELANKELVEGAQQVSFDVSIDEENLINKPYFFEALVGYRDAATGEISYQKAYPYGANANISQTNGVLISMPALKGGAAADTSFDINSLIPGLQPTTNLYR